MRQDHRFVWIDVENTKEWDDEIDIENFPTVLVIDESGHKRFQGPIEPHVGTLAKLLDALQGGQPQALEVGLDRLFAKLQRLFITHSGNYMDLA
jgi:thioredoxin 1